MFYQKNDADKSYVPQPPLINLNNCAPHVQAQLEAAMKRGKTVKRAIGATTPSRYDLCKVPTALYYFAATVAAASALWGFVEYRLERQSAEQQTGNVYHSLKQGLTPQAPYADTVKREIAKNLRALPTNAC